jgi:hypothetical protein
LRLSHSVVLPALSECPERPRIVDFKRSIVGGWWPARPFEIRLSARRWPGGSAVTGLGNSWRLHVPKGLLIFLCGSIQLLPGVKRDAPRRAIRGGKVFNIAAQCWPLHNRLHWLGTCEVPVLQIRDCRLLPLVQIFRAPQTLMARDILWLCIKHFSVRLYYQRLRGWQFCRQLWHRDFVETITVVDPTKCYLRYTMPCFISCFFEDAFLKPIL